MVLVSILKSFVVLTGTIVSTASASIFQGPEQLLPSKAYDYIIVGGGAAGSVLAHRLTESSQTTVLLVEAGSSDFNNLNIIVPQFAGRLANTQFDWNFTTAAQPGLNGRSIPYQRGHVLGGSTSVNFMAFTRGSKDDWDRWSNVTDDEGWSWRSMEKFAKKMEHFVHPSDGRSIDNEVEIDVHGHNGPVHAGVAGSTIAIDSRVIDTTQQLPTEFPFNLDQNSGSTVGIGWTEATIANGERQSAAHSYLQPILKRKNLDIVVNTHAVKVLQTGAIYNTPVFRGIQLSQPGSDKSITVRASREVILSAGAVKTPQLLMLSGIGDRTELSKFNISTIVELPDVGKNLQDHPLVTSAFTVNSTNTLDSLSNPTVAAEQLDLWMRNRTGELGLPTGNQLGWLRLPRNSSIFETESDPSAGPSSAHYEFIFFDAFIGFGGAVPTSGNFLTAFTAVVSPSSRGFITLNSSNPFKAPFIQPSFLSTKFDIFAMRESIKSMRRFLAAPAWKGWIIDEFGAFKQARTDTEIDQYARNNSITINHVSSTAAMGRTGSSRGPGTGVLNSDLTVKGTIGLRVVDASAFPFIPASHTQVPTYMLAERAAELIKGVESVSCV